jgi:serine/threonine protein kinase
MMHYCRNTTVPLYIVTEWIDGQTLQKHVDERRPSLDEAVGITLSLVDIIDRCHRFGLIHRDIKPDNVMLLQSPDGYTVKLIDFGLSGTSAEEAESREIRTDPGEELGNRFLRLPER